MQAASTIRRLAVAAALLAGCDQEDRGIVAPVDELDGGTGEQLPDAADLGAGGQPADSTFVPDAVPFDALPISEPEAPSAPLLAEIREFQGRFALYARNLVTGGAVAHGAEEWLYAGQTMRLFPAALYARMVAAGALDPEQELLFTEPFYRGETRELAAEQLGQRFKLSRLASWTVLSANPAAEELLLSAIGGAAAVNALIEEQGLEGIGKYLGPCEADRAYWRRLDARFDEVSCGDLAVWSRDGDARGISPDPFAAPPIFTDEQKSQAWTEVMEAREGSATARGLGEALARVHGHALPDAAGSPVVRDLLDHALGSGGGGNDLPDKVWVSNLQGAIFQGRVWAALIRGGDAPMALVLMSDRESGGGGVGERFDRAGRLAYEQLVGPVDLSPPEMPAAHPEWLGGIFIHEQTEASHCNQEFSQDYEGLRRCRAENQRERFALHESTAATIMVNDGPDVEATWLWTEPDGSRHRYQVKLPAGGWWAWTRSFEAVAEGDWRLDVWINAEPHLLGRFPVVSGP